MTEQAYFDMLWNKALHSETVFFRFSVEVKLLPWLSYASNGILKEISFLFSLSQTGLLS